MKASFLFSIIATDHVDSPRKCDTIFVTVLASLLGARIMFFDGGETKGRRSRDTVPFNRQTIYLRGAGQRRA
jgi:hypothetical protein